MTELKIKKKRDKLVKKISKLWNKQVFLNPTEEYNAMKLYDLVYELGRLEGKNNVRTKN